MHGHDRSPPGTTTAHPGWRRPLLLLAGTTLLTIGAAMTWVRMTEPEPFRAIASAEGPSEPDLLETESVELALEAPPPEAEDADDEAGGYGVRHKGEEGVMGHPSAKQLSGLYAMSGSGLVSTGRPQENRTTRTTADRRSTFSVDVDTASYSLVRRMLRESGLPHADTVRTEELINYFDYDYPVPTGDAPFSVTAELGDCPWNADRKLLHVGLQGKVVAAQDVPARNLVFLIDVSGSMEGADRLGLARQGLQSLTEQLDADDRVSIVVYAGAAGQVLPPTPGDDHPAILDALQRLSAGGGTNGSQGIDLAYATAQSQFIKGGINRVILLTDGDFNVGVSDHDELIAMIERKRDAGVSLSVLGFGFGNTRDSTMEQLADHGNGNYAYIDSLLEARKVFVDEAASTLMTIAKDVKLQVEFDPETVESFRLIGYENRVLAHQDFDDDTKDAGEIGAGHTVTALYEVDLREGADADDALLDLGIRYKDPDGDESRRIDHHVDAQVTELAETSDDFRFSAAVAGFGLMLRESEYVRDWSFGDVQRLAFGAMGDDPHCYRAEFLELVSLAGRHRGESLQPPATACQPHAPEPARTVATEVFDVHEDSHEVSLTARARAWIVSIPDVLHVLPPLLAFPFFVLAWRDRRRTTRRRQGT
jgi:Ca-activated chloride channel family protein